MKHFFRHIFDRIPILQYIVSAFVKCFLMAVLALGTVFAVLWFTGVYTKLENVLDLKYDSPFILVPLFSFAALAVLCFFVGFLLYFHKYKRTKTKSRFQEALADIYQGDKDQLADVSGSRKGFIQRRGKR